MGPFDAVVDEYESGRPGYPHELFDALEPIAGLRVVEGGAGTGLATRTLVQRGARMVAIDIGIGVALTSGAIDAWSLGHRRRRRGDASP